MKIPYNILIQIKMSVRPYFKGFTLIFFFYNCRKQEYKLYLILTKISFIKSIFFVQICQRARFPPDRICFASV